MKDIIRQIVVLLSILAMIVVNILANALPFNNLSTGEISDQFKVLFVPAGYVFSIWGVIYIGLIAYAIYQLLPSQKDNPRMRRTGYLVALSGVANGAWLFLWHYEQFPATLLAMLALLGLLIAIYLRLDIGKAVGSAAEKWAVQIPFSVYLGWVTVATVANVTSVLYYLKWDGFGLSPEGWMPVILTAVWLIAALVSLSRKDIAYNLVILWALAGIAVKHAALPFIAAASLAAAAQVLLVLVYSRLRR